MNWVKKINCGWTKGNWKKRDLFHYQKIKTIFLCFEFCSASLATCYRANLWTQLSSTCTRSASCMIYVVAHVKHSKSVTCDIPFKLLEVICTCRRNTRFWNWAYMCLMCWSVCVWDCSDLCSASRELDKCSGSESLREWEMPFSWLSPNSFGSGVLPSP